MVNENEVITIKLDDIIPNRFQPREMFDEESMQELADSIKLHGVIQPIIVRPVGDKYEIIAGERRYKASAMAGKVDIPALVRNKDDKDSSIIAFIENSQRKNVTAIEEAKTCERLLMNNDLTQEQLAKQLGMSQSTLANKLRLLTLPVEIQDAVLHGDISERHARSLLSVKDTKVKLDLLERIKAEKLTVRELDGVIKSMMEEPNKDGLYNLPGSEEDIASKQASSNNNDGGMDFSRYENAPAPALSEAPAAPAPEAPKSDLQFLDFLNTLDTDKMVENVGKDLPEVPTEETTTQSQEDADFASFANNFETSVPAEQPAPTPAAPEAPKADNEFLSFLNNFDASTVIPDTPVEGETKVEEAPAAPVTPAPTPEQTSEDKKFDDFLSNFTGVTAPAEPPKEEKPASPALSPEGFEAFLGKYNDNTTSQEAPATPTPAEPTESNEDFLSFLNEFDTSKVLPDLPAAEEAKTEETPAAPEAPASEGNDDFLAFLNKFEEKTPPAEEKAKEAPAPELPTVESTPAPDNDFNDFLKKYEAPIEEPVDLGPVNDLKPESTTVNESANIAETMDVNAKYLNPIEEVAPKVEYVENSPTYVDVTKPVSYDSVDSIIGKLKVVTDEIKKSKYKITTEETDFDDVYTITIKIDKRNFL